MKKTAVSLEPFAKASRHASLLISDLHDVHRIGIATDPMLEILALDLIEAAQKLKERINHIANSKGVQV